MALNTALWSRKAQLTLASAMIAGGVGGMCVPVTHHAFITNAPEFLDTDSTYHPLASGADIRFTLDEAGQVEVPFEIESYTPNATPSLARCEIWVRLPSVVPGASVTFWAWWGNASATAYAVTETYGRNAVWSDYLAVWHCSSRYAAMGGTATDSTGNGYVMLSWSIGGNPSALVATTNLPAFGEGLTPRAEYGQGMLRTLLPITSFMNADAFNLELYIRTSVTPALSIVTTTTGYTATTEGTMVPEILGLELNDWGDVDMNIRCNYIEGGGTDGQSKFLEMNTWTWMTIGRKADFFRGYIGDGLVYANEAPGNITTGAHVLCFMGSAGSAAQHPTIAEVRVRRSAPDESRHTTSRNIMRNIATAIVASTPVAAPYVTTYDLTLQGIVSGSRYRVELVSDGSLLLEGTSTGANVVMPYSWSGDVSARLIVRKSSVAPKYLEVVRALTLGAGDQTVIVEQQRDTNAV